jgi:hypothetical protein
MVRVCSVLGLCVLMGSCFSFHFPLPCPCSNSSSIPPRHHTGVFFLFGAGRLALVRSQPSKALTYYARAAQAQTQYRNLHHISWWESAVACLGLWRWVFRFYVVRVGVFCTYVWILIAVFCRVAESKSWWGKLGGEATVGLSLPLSYPC